MDPRWKPKKSRSSLKAQQRLCLPKLKEDEYLNLKKTTIQTIMKKQRRFRASQIPLDRKKFLQYELCARKVELKAKKTYLFQEKPLPLCELERYRQILSHSKNIQAIEASSWVIFPPQLFKAIVTIKALRTLDLCFLTHDLMAFSEVLGSLESLRKLGITIISADKDDQAKDKTVGKAISQISQHLISRKNLRALRIVIPADDCISSESFESLLNTISNLNLPYFHVTLALSKETTFDPRPIHKFLEKPEYLFLGNGSVHEEPPQNKQFYLLRRQAQNVSDILMHCHSLQRLDFNFFMWQDNFSPNFGHAKGITELKLFFHDKNNHSLLAQQLCPLISEASNLDSLSITISEGKDLTLIHDCLKNCRLRNYHLYIHPSLAITEIPPQISSNMWPEIANIESLENLSLDICFLEDAMEIAPLFKGLPKLRALSLRINQAEEKSSFPFECFGLLSSLEELIFSYPGVTKNETLPRLPKMPKLKNLSIQDASDENNEDLIQINDYNKRFLL